MKTNKVDKPNFKAIYKLPYSQKTAMEIKKVIPIYTGLPLPSKKALFFEGRNPQSSGVQFWMKAIARQQGASVEWLKTNAEKHGFDPESLNEGYIHVITGEEDCQAIEDFVNDSLNKTKEKLLKMAKHKTSIIYKVKKLFIKDEDNIKYPKGLPEHLKFLFGLVQKDKEMNEDFKNAFPNIIEVNNTKELFSKMTNK